MERSCLTSLRIAPCNYCIRKARSFSTAFALKKKRKERKEIRKSIQPFLSQLHPQFHVKTKTLTASTNLPTTISGRISDCQKTIQNEKRWCNQSNIKNVEQPNAAIQPNINIFYFCTCKATIACWNLENSWGLQCKTWSFSARSWTSSILISLHRTRSGQHRVPVVSEIALTAPARGGFPSSLSSSSSSKVS